MFDIITIGDTTTDIFLAVDENSSLCSVDKKKLELKFRYASKIPVKNIYRVIGGGNASNFAFGSSRLGLKTGIYTIVGKDDAGEAVYNKMRREGISTKYVMTDSENGTNLSTVIDYAGDRTILSYHAERTYQLPNLTKTHWIFFSSIHGNHEEFNRNLVEYIKNNNIKLGFNPGSRQMELGVKKLMSILSVTEIVFINKDEARYMTKEINDIKVLLSEMKNLGPKIVVITDGRQGSYCFDGKDMYHAGIINLPVVERTGCGDAYASGFISGLAHGNQVPEAMRWGSANAGGAASAIGSQAGLLTKKQLQQLLSEHEHYQVEVL